ncbi:TPA: type IV toxin-antitoxin system YeeU family antitoxin [Escherichia coli]|uniref:type IV toxin-antitoxin system YeeU family antitoxin n=1 Tax=Escherichia coli TaxID=562 RepID=UPI002257B541
MRNAAPLCASSTEWREAQCNSFPFCPETCDADTLGSCDYVYLAVYPATETESNPPE